MCRRNRSKWICQRRACVNCRSPLRHRGLGFLKSDKSKWLCYIRLCQWSTCPSRLWFQSPTQNSPWMYDISPFSKICRSLMLTRSRRAPNNKLGPTLSFMAGISPRFPPELERKIFEIAVHDKQNKEYVNLMLVAHRVHDW